MRQPDYTGSMTYSAIVLAAGSGTRSGLSYNKVLFPYKNRPLLEYSIELFEQDPDCSQIVVVCAPKELAEFEQRFSRPKTTFTAGGRSRQASVYHGLMEVKEANVLIHDGARPFASPELLERIKKALKTHRAVVPGIEVVDTIKEIDDGGYFIRTPQRARLRAVQTPQAFRTDLVARALNRAMLEDFPVTDDAMAVEIFEHVRSYCVKGELTNLKVTSALDLRKLDREDGDGTDSDPEPA